MGAIFLLIAALVVGMFAWKPVMRGIKVDALAEADSREEVDRLINEYLALVVNDPLLVRADVMRHEELPFDRKLDVLEAIEEASDGRAKMFSSAIDLAQRRDISSAQRIRALELADELFDQEQHGREYVPDEIEEWAAQPDRELDERDRDLSIAAIRLLVTVADLRGVDSYETLEGIVADGTQDDQVIQAAISGLADLTDEENVGSAIAMLRGDNADMAARNQDLLDAIFNGVRARHLADVMLLQESPIPEVEALGYKAMAGPFVNLGDSDEDMATREKMALVVNERLTQENLEENPGAVDGLLEVIETHRLAGTREKLLALVPHVFDNDLRDRFAKILGETFIQKDTEAQEAVSAEVVETLARALDREAERPVAVRALSRLPYRVGGLPFAVEKLVENIETEGAVAAMGHIVGQLFRRPDLVARLGEDAAKWKEFIEADRPNREKIAEIWAWYEENHKYQRASDGNELLRENYETINAYLDLLVDWLENESYPLGSTPGEIEEIAHGLKVLKKSVGGSLGGINDEPEREIPDTSRGGGGDIPEDKEGWLRKE